MGKRLNYSALGVCILGGYKWPHAVLCGGEVLWLQAHVQLYFCAQDVMRFACVVWVGLPGYL